MCIEYSVFNVDNYFFNDMVRCYCLFEIVVVV